MAPDGRLVPLGAALLAGVVLLLLPHPSAARPQSAPALAQMWPTAQRGTIPADLPDGMAYEPAMFLDVKNSVGTAPSPDGKLLRLIIRRENGAIRELRRIPMASNPSFASPTASSGALFWAENAGGRQQLWTAGLHDNRPARRLTTDTGDARFYQSQYDMVITKARLYWVAAAPPTDTSPGTEIRSVALAGGPVDVRVVPGTWALTAWPWMMDGLANTAGTGRLRNILTGRERTMPLTRRGVTTCNPTWCQAVAIDERGRSTIEVVRSDGRDRRRVAQRTGAPLIADVAVLNRFEIFCRVTDWSMLTGRSPLLVYDITADRTVQISPEAGDVGYRAGILWWSTGNRESFLRHTVDLRTVW